MGIANAAVKGYTAYGFMPLTSSEGVFSTKLVKFNTTEPANVNEVASFDRFIRAGVCIDGTYYMMAADDGLVCYSFLKMHLATQTITEIANYSTSDRESALMVMDMAYDATTDNIYALAFDITGAVEDESGNLDIPFGLFTIDKETGKATLMGYQDFEMLYSMAFNQEGQLVVLSSQGVLWNMIKETGTLAEEVGYADQAPSALQSMTFDKDGLLWWAGFNEVQQDTGNTPNGFLGCFTFNPDEYFYEFKNVGKLGNNIELVGLYIDPIIVSADAPAAVTSLTATPGKEGAAYCSLKWKNPTQTYGGGTLADGFSINVYRNEELVKTYSDCKAGTEMTFEDKNMTANFYRYKVETANKAGNGVPAFSENIFIGTDIPGAVEELKAVKNSEGYDITVSWNIPSSGANNGWFDKNNLTYKVVRYPGETVLYNDLKATTFTDKTITELKGYYYKVTAVAASGEGVSANSNAVVSGPAIEKIPYVGDFSSTDGLNLWTVTNGDNDEYSFKNHVYGNGTCALRYFPENKINPETAANEWIASVPIKLEAGKFYSIDFKINGFGEIFPINYQITIGKDTTPASQTKVLGTYPSEAVQGVTSRSLIFSVEETGIYHIGFNILNTVMFELHGFEINERHLVELEAVSLTGSKTPQLGAENAYDVVIKNNGVNTIYGYKVALFDEQGTELTYTIQNEPLESLYSKTTTVYWTPTKASSYKIYATVTVEGDANVENNKTESLPAMVLGNGKWVDITEGKSMAPSYPFNISAKHGLAQTIYTQQEVGGTASTITAVKFYPYVFGKNEVDAFTGKIYMANTAKTSFEGNDPISQSEFQLVYSGTLKVNNGDTELPIMLDSPFNYSGGNICIMTVSETKSPSYYLSWYGKSAEKRQLSYSSKTAPFDFTQAMKSEKYLPNISFFTSTSGGVNSLSTNGNLIIYPSMAQTVINVKSDSAIGDIEIYSTSGILQIKTSAFARETVATLNISNLQNGCYILKTNNAARMFVKQ